MARRSSRSVVQAAETQSSLSDVEGHDSQRLLALNSLLQKPKTNHKELDDFQATVTLGRRESKALLERRTRQAEEVTLRRRNELTNAFLDALQTPNLPMPSASPTFGNTKIARNATFKSIADILRESERLIDEYGRLERLIASVHNAEPKGVAEAWAKGVEKTSRLLIRGAAAATRNVKRVLGAEIDDDVMETTGEEAEEIAATENMELKYELRNSLQFAERGVRNMVKSLPTSE